MEKYLLSILIPVYNASKFLNRCIDSIVKQKEFNNNVEIVIINDGSKDNSLEIINSYISKYNNIHVISRENQGIGPTRNELLDNTHGKYFWFVDADDYISKDSLSKIIPLLQSDSYDMLLLSYYWGSNEKGKNVVYSGEYESGLDLTDKDIHNNSLWTRVYRTSIINDKKIRFNMLQMGEDFDFIIRITPKLGRIKCVEDVLYYYILNPYSAILNPDLNKRIKSCEDSLKCLDYINNFVKKQNNDVKSILKKHVFFFVSGLIIAIYSYPFPIQYKLDIFNRLSNMDVLPWKPLPQNFKKKILFMIVNNRWTRYISIYLNNLILHVKSIK